jgi:hypothetical protein
MCGEPQILHEAFLLRNSKKIKSESTAISQSEIDGFHVIILKSELLLFLSSYTSYGGGNISRSLSKVSDSMVSFSVERSETGLPDGERRSE